MYCPKCATQNPETGKFCRVCGANLEGVAMALASDPTSPDKRGETTLAPAKPADWLGKKREGIGEIIQGNILLLVSGLILLAALAIIPKRIEAFGVWAIFFGWLACWGAFALSTGLSKLVDSKIMKRALASAEKAGNRSLPSADESNLALPPSVTEHTTRQLAQVPKKKLNTP